MLEDQLKWYTANFADTVMPRDMLRDHLQEALSPAALAQQTACLGNRASACGVDGKTLVFSCAGAAGQNVVMNLLNCKGDPVKVWHQVHIMHRTSSPALVHLEVIILAFPTQEAIRCNKQAFSTFRQ